MNVTEEDSPRLVLCPACESEGCSRLLDSEDGFCPCNYYGRGPRHNCEHACPCCEGTGGELIATEPVTLEDLELLDA